MNRAPTGNIPSRVLPGSTVLLLCLGLIAALITPSQAATLASCSDLYPQKISSLPAQRGVLVFVDMGADGAALSAEVTFEGIAQAAPMLVEPGDDQSVHFAMPLHPANFMGGGQATLQLRIGELQCPPVELTIQPLPPAPGGALNAVAVLEDSIVSEAARIGYSREVLLGARQRDLPQEVFALALAVQLLAGPNNPDSARAILSEPDFDLAVLDGLFEVSGLSSAIVATPRVIASGRPRSLSRGGGAGGMLALAAIGPSLMALSQGTRGAGAEGQVYLTPAELDAQMAEQAYHASRLEGVNGLARDAVGLTLGAAGALSVLAGPPGAALIGGTATVGGLLLTAQTLQIEYYKGTLPSRMQALSLEVTRSDFEEDSEETGRWEASLTAASTGFSLGVGDVIGAVPGLGKMVGSGGKILLKRQGVELIDLPQGAEFILSQLDFMRGLMGKFIDAGLNESFPVVDPKTFVAVIDVDRPGERDYVEWSLLGADNAFVFMGDQSLYEPRREGSSELRVQTVGQRFQGQQRLMNQDLTVHPIVVTVTGPGGSGVRIPILPGEAIELGASSINAIDDRLQWTAPGGGSIAPLAQTDGGGPFRAVFTAPDEVGDYFVEVESMSRTGPRRSGQPRRYGLASLRAERLRIDPVAICIEPGNTESFRAFYPDGGDLPSSQVNWSAESGRVDRGGNYTAPRSGRADRVTVSEKDNPDISASASVRIGGCDCRWVLSSSGYGRLEGDNVAMAGIGAAALSPPAAPAQDLFSLQGMEAFLPPEVLEALKQAQAGLEGMPSGAMAYPATTFSLGAEDLPGITMHWHVNPAGSDMGTFTMPNGMIYVFAEDAEGSYGTLQWSEIERGLIRGQFNARAVRIVSVEPEIVVWNVVSGQFTMDPIAWQTAPGSPPMVGCPDPNPNN